jgi:hypothetical protein
MSPKTRALLVFSVNDRKTSDEAESLLPPVYIAIFIKDAALSKFKRIFITGQEKSTRRER